MQSFVLAEFPDEEALLAAARRLRELGHRELDLHSPVPIHEAAHALGLPPSPVPRWCLAGGLLGAATGYGLQWWTVGVDFPINVGNRPPHSPLAFVPITFELAVLFASFAVFFGLMARFRFPRPHHPAFEVEGFRRASVDALWLSCPVEGDPEPVAAELRRLGGTEVSVVPGGEVAR